MRIVHVGNFGTKLKGAAIHSVAPKLSRGLRGLGHEVEDFADRDLAAAATPLRSHKAGRWFASRKLIKLVARTQPDLLVLGHADVISAATIAKIRRNHPRLRVLQWNVDPLFEPDNVERLRRKLDVVDATLVSTAGDALRVLARPGMVLGFLPNPVDFAVETGQAHLKRDLPHDLFYACGNPGRPLRHFFGRAWNMDDFIRELQSRVPQARMQLGGVFGTPTIHGAAYQAALETCACGLNASRRNDAYLYSSDRLAHMIGNGEAILMDRATGYTELFAEDQMAFFGSFDELAGQLARLIAEPEARMAMAAAGRARYHALFNAQAIAAYLVEAAMGNVTPSDYEFPTLVS